jgi:hypothetical protein
MRSRVIAIFYYLIGLNTNSYNCLSVLRLSDFKTELGIHSKNH